MSLKGNAKPNIFSFFFAKKKENLKPQNFAHRSRNDLKIPAIESLYISASISDENFSLEKIFKMKKNRAKTKIFLTPQILEIFDQIS